VLTPPVKEGDPPKDTAKFTSTGGAPDNRRTLATTLCGRAGRGRVNVQHWDWDQVAADYVELMGEMAAGR
jgi:hypothetical protein